MQIKVRFIIVLLLLIYGPNVYSAAPSGPNISCTLTTANIAFPSFYPYNATFVNTTGSIRVRCINNSTVATQQVNYTISFSSGLSGNQLSRIMYQGVNTLAYNFYKDTSLTQKLGDGTGGSFVISFTFTLPRLNTVTSTFPLYGRIPIQILAKPGNYSDTINATLTY